MVTNIEDPRTALLAAPMSTFQMVAIGVVVVLCMLDGLDVMAITFAMPAIKAAWGIDQSQVGLVLASGLIGMATGSFFLAPLADLIGRRRLIFLSLTIMITGTLWSAATDNVGELILSRVYTGLGIGAMIAVISSLSAEYSNTRRRDFCQSMFGIGFPIGGMFGGFLASHLLPSYGWPAIFVAASIFGLVLVPIAWKFLPEPIAPMIARPKPGTLERVNLYLKRCGMAAISQLPPPPVDAKSAPLKALFAPGMASVTVMIAAIYFLHVVTLFFAQSWTPSLIASLGFAPAEAARIAVWFNLGGIVGGPLLGASSMRFGLKPLAFAGLAGGALMTVVFGRLPAEFVPLLLGTIATGFFLQGGMIGLYAVIARTFPAHMRASGTGFVIGVGRVGSAVGPALAGVLMTAGVARGNVAIAMAIPAFLAALLLLTFPVRAPNTP